MDVLDRVRAANPAAEEEFAGLADFAALERPARRRRRLLPCPRSARSSPRSCSCRAPPRRQGDHPAVRLAMQVDDGILYARSHAQIGPTGGAPTWSGSRRVWVRGDAQMRWLDDGGDEEVYAEGEGTTRRRPTASRRRTATCGWSPPRSSAPGPAGLEGRGRRSRRPTTPTYSAGARIATSRSTSRSGSTRTPTRRCASPTTRGARTTRASRSIRPTRDDRRVQAARGHA